jgi:hypothetical protein
LDHLKIDRSVSRFRLLLSATAEGRDRRPLKADAIVVIKGEQLVVFPVVSVSASRAGARCRREQLRVTSSSSRGAGGPVLILEARFQKNCPSVAGNANRHLYT